MKTATVKIKLGNAAMETLEDIAEALRNTANKIEEGNKIGIVVDLNGNVVGNYKII